MSRIPRFRPFAAHFSPVRSRVTHSGALSIARFVSRPVLAAALGLCAFSASGGAARADEFSPVPTGDPIYRQLRALDSAGATAAGAGAELTRYEAAMQVARIITRVSNDSSAQLSRAGWRALRDLSGSLKGELARLGIHVEAAQNLAESRLKAPEPTRIIGADDNSLDLNAPGGLNGASRALPARFGNGILGGATGGNFWGAPASDGSTLLQNPGIAFAPNLQNTEFSASIVPRLRVGAALLALQRAENDPFQSAGAGQALLTSASSNRILGSNASVDYDVNSWLSVRALSSRRSLEDVTDISPLLRTSLFEGAREARSAGGGASIDIGGLSLSTRFERLSTDTGARGTSIDGGVRLSAWQNRLSLSAHMARLQPEDRAVVPLTRTELNIRANVSQRLSLNLFYQGLFAQQNFNNSERVAGGLNLSF